MFAISDTLYSENGSQYSSEEDFHDFLVNVNLTFSKLFYTTHKAMV